ncbi:thioesterase family protein [Halorarius halobius]|uniref:thioesterase family protein n=1 Tax=Halorarius halobius TaxID=2962671 RepID=UPI0020CC1B31|nr:thioesterase family protein [Halorarius halobius]
MVDLSGLDGRSLVSRRTFTVERSHTTNVFGEQSDPPARPAAHDAAPDEPVRVLGSPALLGWVEFTGRDSLHGHLPDGTGTVGVDATLHHRGAAPLGTDLAVETELVDVDGSNLTFEGRVERPDGSAVGEVTTTFRVVDRERFRDSLPGTRG